MVLALAPAGPDVAVVIQHQRVVRLVVQPPDDLVAPVHADQTEPANVEDGVAVRVQHHRVDVRVPVVGWRQLGRQGRDVALQLGIARDPAVHLLAVERPQSQPDILAVPDATHHGDAGLGFPIDVQRQPASDRGCRPDELGGLQPRVAPPVVPPIPESLQTVFDLRGGGQSLPTDVEPAQDQQRARAEQEQQFRHAVDHRVCSKAGRRRLSRPTLVRPLRRLT